MSARQMALEALKGLWIQKPGGGLNGDSMSMHCVDMAQKAIAALEAELAWAVEPVAVVDKRKLDALKAGDDSAKVWLPPAMGDFEMTLYAAPQEPVNADLLNELKKLRKAYVNLLESGRNCIINMGGTCDEVAVMEANDPSLRSASGVIAKAGGAA